MLLLDARAKILDCARVSKIPAQTRGASERCQLENFVVASKLEPRKSTAELCNQERELVLHFLCEGAFSHAPFREVPRWTMPPNLPSTRTHLVSFGAFAVFPPLFLEAPVFCHCALRCLNMVDLQWGCFPRVSVSGCLHICAMLWGCLCSLGSLDRSCYFKSTKLPFHSCLIRCQLISHFFVWSHLNPVLSAPLTSLSLDSQLGFPSVVPVLFITAAHVHSRVFFRRRLGQSSLSLRKLHGSFILWLTRPPSLSFQPMFSWPPSYPVARSARSAGCPVCGLPGCPVVRLSGCPMDRSC